MRIPDIYIENEIPACEAKVGDMVINRTTGMWSRIATIWCNNPDDADSPILYLTKHGDEYILEDIMIVRY